MQRPSTLSGFSHQNFPLKKLLVFSPKKAPCTFWFQPSKFSPKKNLSYFVLKKAALKNFLIFSPKIPPNFQETELSYILKKVYLQP